MTARQSIHCPWAMLSIFIQVGMLQYSRVGAQSYLAAGDVAALKAVRSWLHEVDDTPDLGSFFSSWVFHSDPCSFDGVLCDIVDGDTRVAALNLGFASGTSAGLRGRLHPAVGSLTALVQLSLAPGKVGGAVPSSLSRLSRLQNLGLSHNLLSGNIPPGLATISSLVALDLSFNRLSGNVPAQLASLPRLATLRLAHNRLSGDLPATFHGCASLDHIDLSHNLFTGPLPSLPPSVTHLDMSRNRLSGDLHVVKSLVKLYYLDLSRNQLAGALPPSLLSAPLTLLSVHHNFLSGPLLPDELVIVPTVDLSFNQLSGPVSPFFAFTHNLYLNNNHFTGAVPQEFLDQLLASSMRTLYLQHNFLTNFPPLPYGSSIPLTASVCVQYNCMQLPPLDSPCHHIRASRPSTQCRST
ncbi:hypothetical protein KP509_19G027000 [Ceratopteris richardii]|uniref:Leucine-rich repeat-containing N-terminal plant-type domain-containing protein n=1 Tax=Ceratopteris richardii TaxID=49495 RepID=A0A8T2SIQ3_CERRI|nr:hypothetical protein KP509_19G027000 [Ceratopteris richardii]